MRGTKRLATSSSELAPESNDTGMRTKRAMGSFSDVHKAVTSQKQFKTATPSLDVQRAELSRQHVRALNSQFARSAAGCKNNLRITLMNFGKMEFMTILLMHPVSWGFDLLLFICQQKFSDVVNWLKANGAKGGLGAESSASDKKPSPDTNKINENNLSNERQPAFASTSTSFTTAALPPAIFSYNQSSGAVSSSKNSSLLLSNSQSSGMFCGSQSPALPTNSQTSGLLSSSQSTGIFSNSKLGSLADNQSAGLFSKSQTHSAGLLSNSQGAGVFSKSQTQSSGLLLHSQGAGLFSNSQTQTFGSLSNSQGGNLFSSSSGPALFSSSQSTGFFSSSPSSGLSSESPSSAGGFASVPAPILFGGQSLATTKDNASDDAADGDDVDFGDELPQPGSPSVKKVEEKGVAVVHQVKCKLYVKSIDPADKDTWKDKGPGQLSIKCAEGVSKGTKESSPTLIIRNDLGKVLLNALLYPGIKTSLQKNSVVAIFHVAADDSGSNESVAARTFLIRTKTEDDRDKLATAIREYAPES
ncbi:unnamed protein product [Linum tenue]|uniref:RanBD1 domain-containing protein n=1 Tax=Linum tenue TaxID=586396 RepID=A0AAV0PMG3_9ROSI|nr:unnamed protein product [Linum tenue]